MIGGLEPDPTVQKVKERDAHIWEDPKMKDLQSSLRTNANKPLLADTRSEGTDVQDRILRRLALQATLGSPQVQASLGATSGLASSRKFNMSQGLNGTSTMSKLNTSNLGMGESPGTRTAGLGALEGTKPLGSTAIMEHLEARDALNDGIRRTTKRLMSHLEFAQGDILSGRSHDLRTAHLDRMHQWFQNHGGKQSKRELQTPHYLTYTKDDRVMVGSLRVEPQEKLFSMGNRQKPAWMTTSASTPTLFNS